MTAYLITPPAAMAFLLADARNAVRADGTALDSQITIAVQGIIQEAEGLTGHCLITQTWQVKVDSFDPDGVKIPHPAQTVGAISYRDADGNEQTLSASNARVMVGRYESRLMPVGSFEWPDTDGTPDAVRFTVTAGFGDTDSTVPMAFKLYCQARLVQQFDPAARLEKDTVQDAYTKSLLDQFLVNP